MERMGSHMMFYGTVVKKHTRAKRATETETVRATEGKQEEEEEVAVAPRTRGRARLDQRHNVAYLDVLLPAVRRSLHAMYCSRPDAVVGSLHVAQYMLMHEALTVLREALAPASTSSRATVRVTWEKCLVAPHSILCFLDVLQKRLDADVYRFTAAKDGKLGHLHIQLPKDVLAMPRLRPFPQGVVYGPVHVL